MIDHGADVVSMELLVTSAYYNSETTVTSQDASAYSTCRCISSTMLVLEAYSHRGSFDMLCIGNANRSNLSSEC